MWQGRAYRSSDKAAFLQLNIEQYGKELDISNADFMQHQYFENPAGDALIEIAEDCDTRELAGQYQVWPIRYHIKGEDVLCANSLNTLTKEEYRGQGIFTGLAENVYKRAAEKGYAFVTGMPNQNSFPGFIKKLDFFKLADIPLLLRPLKPSAMVEEFLKSRMLGNIAKVANPFFEPKVDRNCEGSIICDKDKEFFEAMGAFWNNIKGKYPIMCVRDAEFIRFRYIDMPRRNYHVYIGEYEGKSCCMAVGRIMEVAGMQCAMLVDFLYLEGFEKVAISVLQHFLREMKERGASLAGCLMLKHTQEYKLLRRQGFFSCPKKFEPQPFPLILRTLNQKWENEMIRKIDNWFFTMGDYDAI